MRPGARLAAAAAIGAALGAGACKKQEEPAAQQRGPAIGEAEVKLGRDACRAYHERVCACAKTVPAAQPACDRARAPLDSLELLVSVAAHPETERQDARQQAAAVRKIIAGCVEQTARLPALGCPAPALGGSSAQ